MSNQKSKEINETYEKKSVGNQNWQRKDVKEEINLKLANLTINLTTNFQNLIKVIIKSHLNL